MATTLFTQTVNGVTTTYYGSGRLYNGNTGRVKWNQLKHLVPRGTPSLQASELLREHGSLKETVAACIAAGLIR